jgi:glucosamine 6-phosphate synthetase-like amidotransferase/phosphosugar isomerase protein
MNNSREFLYHMLREIYEQDRAVRDTLAGRLDIDSGAVTLETSPSSISEMKSLTWIRVAASGTSRYAGLFGKCAIEELAGVPVEVEYATELEYRRQCSTPPLTIVISQSGETSDTLTALRRAKQAGSRTLAICNVENSLMPRQIPLSTSVLRWRYESREPSSAQCTLAAGKSCSHSCGPFGARYSNGVSVRYQERSSAS